MRLRISAICDMPPDGGRLEIVERKGVGHPDTLCDALVENVSVGLSRWYLEHFGAILHHNVDKALLIGGAARPAFGGGEVLEPIEITIAGRATREMKGVRVPVDELACDLSRRWLAANLRHFDPAHFRIVSRIRPPSGDLASLFARGAAQRVPVANDTSFGVGYAPLDALERAVIAVERTLAASATRREHPEWGDDVKVMGWRDDEAYGIVLACAFVGRYVRDLRDYLDKKERLRLFACEAASLAAGRDVEVAVNAADGETPDSLYLTVTGLSAEAGDDGEVGRGNRVNGLITPYRPMSLEAAAGKNPVTHTGKLYNLLADRIASTLVQEIAGVARSECRLLSRIGAALDDPHIADVRLGMAPGVPLEAVEGAAGAIVRRELAGASTLWRKVIEGRVPIF